MTIIIISPEQSVSNEIETINALFEEGLKIFHLRKPTYTEADYCNYLNLINNEYLNRIMIHSHHNLLNEYDLRGKHYNSKAMPSSNKSNIKMSKSCHSISEIRKYHTDYEYLFLSPVFNSISKQGYRSQFTDIELKNINLTVKNSVALGGISLETCQTAKTLGFNCISTLGSIWSLNTIADRVLNFHSMREATL